MTSTAHRSGPVWAPRNLFRSPLDAVLTSCSVRWHLAALQDVLLHLRHRSLDDHPRQPAPADDRSVPGGARAAARCDRRRPGRMGWPPRRIHPCPPGSQRTHRQRPHAGGPGPRHRRPTLAPRHRRVVAAAVVEHAGTVDHGRPRDRRRHRRPADRTVRWTTQARPGRHRCRLHRPRRRARRALLLRGHGGRLRRLGRLHAEPVPRGLLDRALLPARYPACARSPIELPLVRLVCTTYIELVRGAPLFVLLLLANVALGFFVPDSLAPSTSTRAIVVFTLFTAAYMAEIIRGGLQSVPRGQIEAAKAVGPEPVRQTGYIVLPQALRNVIPAQIGQLISLFKDTTLAGIAMGLFELLKCRPRSPRSSSSVARALIGETTHVRRAHVLDGGLHNEPREPTPREDDWEWEADDRRPRRRPETHAVFADATAIVAPATAMIELEGVDKFFDDFQALKNINLRWHPRGRRRHRPLGLGQVDHDPMHQPPRRTRRWTNRRRRHRTVE